MPRIYEGFKRRFGTAEKREYTRIKHQDSIWADYDAGFIDEDLIILDDIPKLHTVSSLTKPFPKRRRRVHQLISLNDEEFKLNDMTKKTLKPPPVVFASISTATAVSTVSTDEILSPTLLSREAASVLHIMSTPIQIDTAKTRPLTTGQSQQRQGIVRPGTGTANTNKLKTTELYNSECIFENTDAKQIYFELTATKKSSVDKQKKKQGTKDMNQTRSPNPTSGDRVFDISDALSKQTTLREWECRVQSSMSLSQACITTGFTSINQYKAISFRTPSDFKLHFDTPVLNDKSLYFSETKVTPVPIVVDPPSFAIESTSLYGRHGCMNTKTRWLQVSPKAFSLEHKLGHEIEGSVAPFTSTDTGRELHWEAQVLKRIHQAILGVVCIPNPIHLCVSAKDKELSLILECNYQFEMLGTLDELLDAQALYNHGGIPESVTAWLVLQILLIFKQVHESGISHNNLSLDSLLLTRKYDSMNWNLLLTGFGSKGSMNAGKNQDDWSFLSDLKGIAKIAWTLLSGGMPFSYSNEGIMRVLDNKSFITSNRFLRGKLFWDELFQTLLNPPVASQGLHSSKDWSNLANTLNLLNMMFPISNGDTPLAVSSFFDTLLSHSKGDLGCLLKRKPLDNIDTFDIDNINGLLAKSEENRQIIQNVKDVIQETNKYAHIQAVQVFMSKDEHEHKRDPLLISNESEVNEIKKNRQTELSPQDKIQFEGKLLDSQTKKQQLQGQLDSLTKDFTKENAGQEKNLPLEELLDDAMRQVRESHLLQEQLKRQVNILTHDVQRWRSKASKIRCKALELQQKEIQLNRVQKLLGKSIQRNPGSRTSQLSQQPSSQNGQGDNEMHIRLTGTDEKGEFLPHEWNRRGSLLAPTNPLMETKSGMNCIETRKNPAVRPDNSLIGFGYKTRDRKHDHWASCSQRIVAEDPYSTNSESD